MATAARELSRFILPARARARQVSSDNISLKLALADRIADLPAIETVERDPNGGSRSVDVFVRPASAAARKQHLPVLLCEIGSAGIVVHGLSNPDRHQVLSRGWGRLSRDGVLLFLPRDELELETAWRILLRAHESLSDSSAAAIPVRTAWFDELPGFSRTNLN